MWRESSRKTRPGKVSESYLLASLTNEGKRGDASGLLMRIPFLLSGGSLGWKTRGSLDPQFETVAFGLESSTTANPKYAEVKTGFGYHIIMVEGRK